MITVKDAISVAADNEGPCTLNDNAQENMVRLARECGLGEEVGVKAYKNFSNIDDIWGDFHRVAIDPTYSSGHTLKVVLPFYKAMGADSRWLYNFARSNLRIVPNIGNVFRGMDSKYNLWQISTSYEFFIKAFCDSIGFDFSKARCTFVEGFDEIQITDAEKNQLLAFMREIAQMPVIEYDGKTGQVIEEHQSCYNRITDFVWGAVYNMPVGEFLRTTHPVGQTQKREALEQICREFGLAKEKVMYIGDSQTDFQCAEWLQGVGLSMLFNGKGKVCRISDIMYIGEDARAIEEVADVFAERGRQGAIDYCSPSREAKCGGLLTAVTPENIDKLESQSVDKRKKFRGVHIGDLT